MMIRFALALVGALTIGLFAQTANASMIALVIGNYEYQSVNGLKNPKSDSRAVSAMFERLGFDVDTAYNLDRAGLTRKLADFKKRAETADTAVFFYAGHGMEIDGINYLIPTDAVLARRDDAEFEAVRLELATSAAGNAQRLSVVLIDACRDNIFEGDDEESESVFVSEPPRQRQLITFSTAPGMKAYDGDGDMSPFAQALVEILPERINYDVRQVFGGLGERVSELAQADQRPHTQSVGFSPDTVTLTARPGDAAVAIASTRAQPPSKAAPSAAELTRASDDTVAALAASGATSRPVMPPPVTLEISSRPVVPAASPAPDVVVDGGAVDGGAVDGGIPAAIFARDGQALPGFAPLPYSPPAGPAPVETVAMALPAAGAVTRPEPTSSRLADFSTFKDCPSCPEMIVLPAGSYEMGASTFSFYSLDNEFPRHEVSVQRFALARYEATFAEWDACRRDGYCKSGRVSDYGWGRGKQPVLRVAYNDIVAPRGFIAWLNAKAGGDGGYRLPTEAEWEYAAAAGTDDDFSTGGSITRSAARFGGLDTDTATARQPSAVGRFPANAWGLHDMHGNVAELVADCWNPSYDDAPTAGEAWMTGDCRLAPVRGGSWADAEENLRVTARQPQLRNGRANRIGFRIAKSIN